MDMSELLTTLMGVGTSALQVVGSVVDCIVGNPLLLFTTGFLFLGGCIGIFGRLLSKN